MRSEKDASLSAATEPATENQLKSASALPTLPTTTSPENASSPVLPSPASRASTPITNPSASAFQATSSTPTATPASHNRSVPMATPTGSVDAWGATTEDGDQLTLDFNYLLITRYFLFITCSINIKLPIFYFYQSVFIYQSISISSININWYCFCLSIWYKSYKVFFV